jgi:hypothetical protein
MMQLFSSQLRARSSWVRVLGIICVSLVLMSGIAQVAHNHASGQPDHDCALCVTAHHVIQIVAQVSLNLSSRPVAAIAAEPTRDLPRRYFFLKLKSRPPPASPVFS